jgi:hypothetical protein
MVYTVKDKPFLVVCWPMLQTNKTKKRTKLSEKLKSCPIYQSQFNYFGNIEFKFEKIKNIYLQLRWKQWKHKKKIKANCFHLSGKIKMLSWFFFFVCSGKKYFSYCSDNFTLWHIWSFTAFFWLIVKRKIIKFYWKNWQQGSEAQQIKELPL